MSASPSDNSDHPLHPETITVHTAAPRSQFGEMSEGLFLTSGFTYPDMAASEARFNGTDPGYVYSRYANPTVTMFEERIARLEGMETARATASGMAAVTASLMCHLRAGDHVVASRRLFGSCLWQLQEYLPRFGIEVSFVSGLDTGEWAAAVRRNTRALFLESPANPTLDVIDIGAVADIAHSSGALLVVDNAMSSPAVQTPSAFGADVVVYSATKHIDGQGRTLGGAVVCSKAFNDEHLNQFMRHTGPAMSPFNAWILGKSLETLELRVERMSRTAAMLADLLAGHPKIASLRYAGRADHPQAELAKRQMKSGGTMIAAEVKGGKEAAFRVADALRVVRISNNFGDAKSIVTHPATTTHQRFTPEARAQMGISDGLLRLSIGLEHPDDLAADFLRALEQA
jgi:O-succinylhomoserine sulfhydrylase